MGGQSERIAPVAAQPSNLGLQNLQAGEAGKQAANNPQLSNIMSQLGNGSLSYKDALAAAQGIQYADPLASQRANLGSQLQAAQAKALQYKDTPDDNPDKQLALNNLQSIQSTLSTLPSADASQAMVSKAATDQLYTDPRTGSLMAAGQVQDNPLFSGLLGKGGIQDQAQARSGSLNNDYSADRNALMGRDESYGLTPMDLAAYGQASDQIARTYGQSGNSLAQSLADRGLGAAPSGAASAQFSGLLGNQNEQLAKAQMQIAQNRIQTAQQLAQSRMAATQQAQAQNNSLMSSLGDLSGQQIQNQYQRNTGGLENAYNTSMGTNNAQLANWAAQQQALNESTASYNQGRGGSGGLGAGIGAVLGGAGGFLASGGNPAAAAVGSSAGSALGKAF